MIEQKRTVISHYHIYKNSGTSFDHVLTHSFGDRHELFDGPYPFFRINQDELNRIIQRKPNAVAFSSHQTTLPQPSALEHRVIAAVFLRHPVLRVASIYRFKRKKNDGTTTSAAAMRMEFGPWLEHCFATRNETGHISNAQTRMLAAMPGELPAMRRGESGLEYDLDTAMRNIRNVELLGRTEHFEADVNRFVPICARYGLTLSLPRDLHRNATKRAGKSTEENLRDVLDPLDPALADRLMAANAQDLAIYDFATRLIEAEDPA